MKRENTVYTCDQCNTEVTVHKGCFAGTNPDADWITIYMKDRPSDIHKTSYHFCSKGCVANYMVDKA